MRLEGKTALITGGARGIGEEITRCFHREGSAVVIADVEAKRGRSLAEELNGPVAAFFIELDVREEPGWKEVTSFILKRFGKLDVLVNNAGISIRTPLESFPVEVWDEMMAVNVRGVFLGMKNAIPPMVEAGGGSIINMSSIAGLIGHKTSSLAYIATKGAVTAMTKGAAVHYAKQGVRVNSIHPSTVDTPLVKDLFQNPEMKRARLEEVPMGRLAAVGDVAGAALYLASDESNFVTGISLPVDGGLTAG